MKTKKFTLTYPWDVNGYKPYTEFELSVDECGFCMHITAWESNPRRVETEHQRDIYKDSCVEWFVNFMPEVCAEYFNFEVNANGAMYAAFRKGRQDKRMLSEEDIKLLNIHTVIGEEIWEVCYHVPFSLIRKYIPQFCYEEGMKIRTNFYKCGDDTEFPHFGIWNESPLEKPDFHRPEYFGELVLE